MIRTVRFTPAAADDLERLCAGVVGHDDADPGRPECAAAAIVSGIVTLESSPFTCRKAHPSMPFLRELLIPFGASGYVALFEIDDSRTVTVLAVRHQRESDYH
ncbi:MULTISPECIES: type II toxin-antitoxin system RelE/ParE family toxin [Burkholderia]|uniref:type II toxin-antitoxin system RelE/ParE family toxin n=1 Tax=Burkholderia TaxID=32008 RepID=UPI0007586608|nr:MULTISPECIES: type II toxin-antitoxin system RelE/ParE family toxin [Burkholderia]KVE67318.1 plasmid stabilization protein [Burkholderia vietnamiensis]MBR8206396.1 type II toxin-antitoxin system RelE/ParE family toxin [Burkholderia vietnamiensis]MCA8395186.1 type II toxin-antitoxin system RelE/ParE family toxin [Burkholderia vietnamiensis]QMI45098.1 type II toxin-antitoxin system RelE/ParE family toxin [Burkholderia sp. MBR-1]HDR8961251.1 type II toxin-antitoxin system RelE/ParE family toxi